MSQDQRTRRGYLLLADISGYTAFLVATELEHASAVVQELTDLIRDRLSPPMRFVKLEGDAVFCHADETSFEDGERLLELVETCYFASPTACSTCSEARRVAAPRARRSARST